MSLKRAAGITALAALLSLAAVASDFAVDPSRLKKSAVRYRDQARISDFPSPVVHARRAGLSAGPDEIAEIDGEARESLIARTPQGNYDPKAHEILLAKPTP